MTKQDFQAKEQSTTDVATKDKSQLTPANQPDISKEPREYKVHKRKTKCTLKTRQLQ